MEVKLINISHEHPEVFIAYCARRAISDEEAHAKTHTYLIRYLLKHKHWSPFEHVTASFKIITSRAISRQILRHRSFTFQEFSQRYAKVQEFEPVYPRRQAETNRQSSIDDLPESVVAWFQEVKNEVEGLALQRYKEALDKGIAKESARFLLPESAVSNLVMTGSLRSWIHYIELRTQEDTQLEHRLIANAIKHELADKVPTIAKIMGWL